MGADERNEPPHPHTGCRWVTGQTEQPPLVGDVLVDGEPVAPVATPDDLDPEITKLR